MVSFQLWQLLCARFWHTGHLAIHFHHSENWTGKKPHTNKQTKTDISLMHIMYHYNRKYFTRYWSRLYSMPDVGSALIEATNAAQACYREELSINLGQFNLLTMLTLWYNTKTYSNLSTKLSNNANSICECTASSFISREMSVTLSMKPYNVITIHVIKMLLWMVIIDKGHSITARILRRLLRQGKVINIC